MKNDRIKNDRIKSDRIKTDRIKSITDPAGHVKLLHFRAHQTWCSARHTVPLLLVNEKSVVHCVRIVAERSVVPTKLVLRLIVRNLPPISHRQVVAKQYVLRNTKSGVL
jgi:hypothetical protein